MANPNSSAIVLAFAGAGAALFAAPATFAQEARGRIAAEVTENGRPAPGRFVVHGPGGEEVARGTSGTAVQVPAGTYDVALTLEGAIDRPEKWVRGLAVGRGATARATAAFETGTVQVQVTAGGRRAAATVLVHRVGEDAEIATLGAGVPGVLSTGTYDFQVRYRSQEQWLRGEAIAAGAVRDLTVSF